MSNTEDTTHSSGAPSDFANAAPFKKKSRKKDGAGSALMALGYAGIALSLIAAAMSFF